MSLARLKARLSPAPKPQNPEPVRLPDRVGVAVGTSVWGVGLGLGALSKNPALMDHAQFLANTAAATSKELGTLGPMMTLGGLYNWADIWGTRAKTALLSELGETQEQLQTMRSALAEKEAKTAEESKPAKQTISANPKLTSRMGVGAGASMIAASYGLAWAAKDPSLAHYVAQSLEGTSKELSQIGPFVMLGGAYHWMDVGGIRAKRALRRALEEARGEVASLERKFERYGLDPIDWMTQKPSSDVT
ncbi:MAG: hypothetical protein ACT4TC_18870 [Myxococcaceae bacterium]